jgi:signal peptidase I
MTAAKSAQRWRENLEALTMAIVVALLFKYFILEISKIPSGSMQPTLMGNPETRIFDRTLVDKLSYRFRDPERFEIVVFKHPLEFSRVMVKRLIGMPGEELKIEHGDLWTRSDQASAWKLLRRPPSVQDEMWRLLDPGQPASASWKVVRGGQGWLFSGRDVEARSAGAMRFREDQGHVRDGYLDGYPAALLGRVHANPNAGRNAVGDLRLAGEVQALPGTEFLVLELTEGRRSYEFRLPGPAAPADSAPELRIVDSGGKERVERGSSLRLPSDRRLCFAAENLDDRLALELEGRVLLAAEIDPSPRQEALLTLSIEGQGAELFDLRAYRDIYYLPPDNRPSWSIGIPAGHYVVLGDNPHDSADSRLWEAKTYTLPDDLRIRGNYRMQGENPGFGRAPDGSALLRFRDVWGEVHWFPKSAIQSESLPGSQPLVPRQRILGRALAVFWPLKPIQGIWRLGWLH